MHLSLSLSLSISMYIHIYIYIYKHMLYHTMPYYGRSSSRLAKRPYASAGYSLQGGAVGGGGSGWGKYYIIEKPTI